MRYDTRAQVHLDIVDWNGGFFNRVRIHGHRVCTRPYREKRSPLAAWSGVRGNSAGSFFLRYQRNYQSDDRKAFVRRDESASAVHPRYACHDC